MKKRRFIVLSGQRNQRFIVARQLVSSLPSDQLLWFTLSPVTTLSGTISHTIDQVLGREHTVVIFDAFSGFNPDAFAALAGTIKAGGALILLCPPLAHWHQFDDPFTQRITSWPYRSTDISGRFIQHFVSHIMRADFIEIVPFADVMSIPALNIPQSQSASRHNLLTPNNEQRRVIAAIKGIAAAQTPAALVVEADRGRGKSATLGMAAAQLMQLAQDELHIVVIAPTLKTVDVLFDHAQQYISISQQQKQQVSFQQGKLRTATASLRFIAPDVALQTLPTADLVLIDEAAAIPSALLVGYLKHYPRLIFATTVHGYEGTGRGFTLRFRHYLDHYCPQWHTEHLHQAIRYQANDSLERFVFNSLLLEAAPTTHFSTSAFTLKHCQVEKLNRDQLLSNTTLLEALFGLLILAHYQTRPTDLRHLLDGQGVSIYAVFWQKKVVATCLTIKEGGFDAELAQAIYYGKRRPQGHLVAQSLAFHAGMADAPLLTAERVMRIVVHPAVQQHGIASFLLKTIEQQITAQTQPQTSIDYLSTSFALTEPMLSFWYKQGFNAVHMGLRRDASSGCHSLIMLKPLSNKGKALLSVAQPTFYLHLPVLLETALNDVEPTLIAALLSVQPTILPQPQKNNLSALDWADVESFANGHRGYVFCLYALRKFVQLPQVQKQQLALLPDQQQQLLQHAVLGKQPVLEVGLRLKLGGKKNIDKQFRCAIEILLKAIFINQTHFTRPI